MQIDSNSKKVIKELIRAVLACLCGLLGGATTGCAFVPVF